MENKKGDLSKNFWYMACAICGVLLLVLILGIVIHKNKKPEVVEEKVKGGSIVMNYTDDITGLSLKNLTPTTDAIGMKKEKEEEYFDFSVDVDVNKASEIDYEIAVIKNTKASNVPDDDIKIYLEKEESGTYNKVFGPESYKALKKDSKLGSPKGSMIVLKDSEKKSIKENYRLRMWLSDKSLIKQGNYSIDVVVNGVAK